MRAGERLPPFSAIRWIRGMECFEPRSVTDRENRSLPELVLEQRQHRGSAVVIQRRSCLVHEDPTRLRQQHTCESHALLLPQGSPSCPISRTLYGPPTPFVTS